MGDIELTGLGGVLRAVGWLYWGLAIGLFFLAAIKPKTWLRKGLWIMGVVLAFGYLPVTSTRKNQQAQKAYEERRAKAEALFKDHCKNAGIKIHRTVDGVEGVYLMKVRTTINHGRQYEMDDPFGADDTKDFYIGSFIGGIDKFNRVNPETAVRPGYKYVEAIDPVDGLLKRFTLEELPRDGERDEKRRYIASRFALNDEPVVQRTARYGVTYDDISTKEDRDYWIAGSSLRVVDLDTNEIIAERIGYMMDPAQGAGVMSGRQAWTYAADNACPAFPLINDRYANRFNQTRLFVEKVLKIKE